MKNLKPCIVGFACAAASVSFGQADPWAFPGQFPQLRDLSGLPGGAFGVLPNGRPSILGAMAISTPIGFSLGPGTWDIGLASRSRDNRPRLPTGQSENDINSDGTGVAMGSIRTPIGNLTGSYVVASRHLDYYANLQLQLPLRWDRGGVSVGVQNFQNRPLAAAEHVPGANDLARSVFIVGTFELSPGAYVSLGKGDVRFRGLFGNVSFMPAPRFKAVVEYDTFGWNAGLAYSLGKTPNIGDRFERNETTLFFGFVQLHRATVALNFSF